MFDGNCKNCRDVCKARDAGYMEYEGLDGVVKTGCMNTPKIGSRYCAEEGVMAVIVGKRSTRSGTYYQVSNGHDFNGY